MAITKTLTASANIDTLTYLPVDDPIILQDTAVYTLNVNILSDKDTPTAFDLTGVDSADLVFKRQYGSELTLTGVTLPADLTTGILTTAISDTSTITDTAGTLSCNVVLHTTTGSIKRNIRGFTIEVVSAFA